MRLFQIIITSIILYFSMMVNISVAASSDTPDPEEWYTQSYGPIWSNKPFDKLDEILGFYHSEIHIHEPEGGLISLNTDAWITDSMKEWVADGWVSSEVPDIRMNRISVSTASFTTRWLDHCTDREDEYSRAWYLANLIDGEWKFTQFAAIDCSVHGF